MDSPQQTYSRAPQIDEIDLRHYWRVVYRQRWNILALAVAISLIVGLAVMSMRLVYRSTLTLMIESAQAKVVSIEEVYGLGAANMEYFLTQFEILKSRELVSKVVRNLEIRHHPDFDPDLKEPPLFNIDWRSYWPQDLEENVPSEEDKIAGVIDSFAAGFEVTPVPNTHLVKISFQAFDPKLTADAVNELASVYIDSHLDAKLEATQKAASWLSERLQGLKSSLELSEQRLQDYRDEQQLVDIEGVKTLAGRELEEVTRGLVEARAKRTEAESIYTQVQALDKQSPEALASLRAVLQHRLVQALKEEEAEAERSVAELSKRYGPLHPRMIAARSKLEAASGNMERQVIRVVAGVENDFKLASSSERALKSQLAEVKAKVREINRKEFKLRELQRDVQTNRQLYDMFFTRIKETDEAGGMEAAHARVVDAGIVPNVAVKPRKRMTILLSFSGSLALGVMLALLKDALDNSLNSPADVEERLNVPMLGAMPKIVVSKQREGPLTLLLEDRQSSFAESIRTIRTGLILSGLDQAHKITVITSSVPGEGKSTLSINLAAALGQMEKTLVIDADMRRPTLAKTCRLAPNTPGLSNFIAGTAELKDCVHRYEEAGVDILAAGVIPSNPLELISSKRFVHALDYLKEKYDRILVDSAPTQAVSDAFVLASYADAVVYVVKADATPYTLAKNGIQRLQNSNAPVVGVILNQFDPGRTPKVGSDYYPYSGYYDYYGYSSSENDRLKSIKGGKHDNPRVA